jgi:hypothetical protein
MKLRSIIVQESTQNPAANRDMKIGAVVIAIGVVVSYALFSSESGGALGMVAIALVLYGMFKFGSGLFSRLKSG